MNCVRKHLSRIKGGRLAAACTPAQVVTLAISDVPGDDIAVIASGPTVPDETTCAEALAILRRYSIELPPSVVRALELGELETPKSSNKLFEGHIVRMVAKPMQSLLAAATVAQKAGIPAHILGDDIEGESREVGKVHAALARSSLLHAQPFVAPCVILSGGETTVTVIPRNPLAKSGRGGRAGEFCLGLAQNLAGLNGVWALAADTDGIDGVEENAGAFVDSSTIQRANAAELSLADHLARNDAYGFFAGLGDLFITGPTHTNVNDFRAVLLLPREPVAGGIVVRRRNL
jgi:hydroxypyruvate reductase